MEECRMTAREIWCWLAFQWSSRSKFNRKVSESKKQGS